MFFRLRLCSIALVACTAHAQTSNTLSADLLEYPFNEARGTTTANTSSTTSFPSSGVLPNSNWQRDPGRPIYSGNDAGFGCLSYAPTATPQPNYVNTGRTFSHTGSLTLMWWARRDPASTVTSPFGYFFSDTSFRCFMGTAGILFSGGSGTPLSSSYTANFQGHLAHGVWNHYAVVIDDAAGVNVIYENAVPHATPRMYAANTYAYAGSANNLIVGGYTNAGSSRATLHFDMDDFRIYGRALTQGEIQTEMASENPTTSTYDAGCTDSNGFAPRLGANGAPRIGNGAFALLASGMEPARPVAIYVGISTYLGGVLPLDLSGSGIFAAGCALSVTPDVALNFSSGSGSVTLPSPIPIDPTLSGGHAYSQLIQLSSGPLSAVSAPLDGNVQF